MTYIIQNISPFPPAPDSVNDTPQNFSIKADTFVAHQADTFVGEANALKTQINTIAGEINTKADEAEASATDSASSALASAGSANFKGTWNSGTSYTVPSSVYLNGLYYNAILGSTNQNPETEFTYWVEQALDLAPAMSYGNVANPLLDLPLNNSLAMKQGVGAVTFARSTTGTYIDRYGVLQYASIDEPRFEKDGLLIEGASTNYILDSNDYTTANWNNQGVTVSTDGTLCSDGVTLANKLTSSALLENHRILPSAIDDCPVGNETLSVDLKAGTHSIASVYLYSTDDTNSAVIVDLSSGTMSTNGNAVGTIKALADGWYRVSMSFVTSIDNGAVRIGLNDPTKPTTLDINWDANGTETIYVAFAQHEALLFASSYIPTTTTAVTRVKDIEYQDVYGNFPNIADGASFAADILFNSPTLENREIIGIYLSTTNYLVIRLQSNNVFKVYSNKDSVANFSYLTPDMSSFYGTKIRVLVVFTSTGSKFYINGELFYTFTGAIEMPNIQGLPLAIGVLSPTTTSNPLNGSIENVRTWDKALTPTEASIA